MKNKDTTQKQTQTQNQRTDTDGHHAPGSNVAIKLEERATVAALGVLRDDHDGDAVGARRVDHLQLLVAEDGAVAIPACAEASATARE